MGADDRATQRKNRSYGVELRSEDSSVTIQATWSQNEDRESINRYSRNTLDLTIQSIARSPDSTNGALTVTGSTIASNGGEPVRVDAPCKGLSLVWDMVSASQTTKFGPMRFLLPAENGYIVRGDFIEFVFSNSPSVVRTQGFVTPGQQCAVARHPEDVPEGDARVFLDLLQHAVGVVVARDGVDAIEMDDAFDNYLGWPWTLPTPIEPRRIVMVGEARRETMAPIFYATAKACGVSVVVLDRPGHWMEDPTGTGAPLREHFVQFADFTLDGLPERICAAIRGLPYHIDGVMSTVEAYLPSVARAAELLGLPTTPSHIYSRTTNKYETRQLCPVPTSIKVESLETFLPQLKAMSPPLQYPLAVKPTHGHGSLGASKVRNEAELIEALHFAFSALEKQKDKVGEARVIVETYCEGPEVDVNLVMWDGEMLFAEVCDTFPCPADLSSDVKMQQGEMGWMGTIYPSALPAEEIEMLKREVLALVKKLGIRNGVVHTEARVHNSSVDWHIDDQGVCELVPRAIADRPINTSSSSSDAPPQMFLLEVNLRPPGNPDLLAISYLYGISYYALQLMQITGDEARFLSLAQGFRDKPLYHYGWTPLLRFEPAATGGRMPRDLGFGNDRLGLGEYYVHEWQLWSPGAVVPPADQVPHPGLGFVLLRSRKSRRECAEKVAIARDKMCIQL
ncbi:hypothetical protein F5Y17DRAFT_441462, partial [Xylariaceae sp. FL0594]